MDAKELSLDVSAEGARALHRVVRAMHDGHCPKCGFLAPAEDFLAHYQTMVPDTSLGHECPHCGLSISKPEEDAALAAFRPHFLKSVEVFEAWRNGQPLPVESR